MKKGKREKSKGEKKGRKGKKREKRKNGRKKEKKVFAVFLLCVLRDTLCLTPVMGCAHMDDHRACRVTSVHMLSTTTKMTESNKVQCCGNGWSGTNTPPDEGGLPPPGVLALCQLSALSHSRKCRFKHFQTGSYSSFEIHICCGSPGPSPTCSDLRTNNKQFRLTAITSQIGRTACASYVRRATHAENYAHCVNCDTNCFETSNANLPRDSFNLLAQQRIRSSGIHRTIAGVQPSCITSSRSSTFPDSLRSAPLYTIQFAFDQSLTRFQISRYCS